MVLMCYFERIVKIFREKNMKNCFIGIVFMCMACLTDCALANECPKPDPNRWAQIADNVIKVDFVSTNQCALQGNIQSQEDLGTLYASGKGNVKQDKVESTKWYEKAALQGDAVAQYELGQHYEIGFGVEKNPQKALEWYMKASDQNYNEAQMAIGLMYAYGQMGQRDIVKAKEWYKKAAKNGNVSAQALGF